MSLVERLFPPAELAAMKQAILTASDEPAAKRRKVDRQDSVRSYRSADSGYNSDESSNNLADKMASKPVIPESFARKPSITLPGSPSTHSHSEEEDFTEVIARARARLYSNASLSLPSPAASHASHSGAEESSNPPSPMYENYHSPVSVEPIAATAATHQDTSSGCNLGTFISLGLAVTSHERKLLTTLVPEPKALPNWQMEAGAAKRMGSLEVRRRLREEQIRRKQQKRYREAQQQQQKQRQSSYAGFAISCHNEDDEADEHDAQAAPVDVPVGSVEKIDDFFNIEAACEDDGEEATDGLIMS